MVSVVVERRLPVGAEAAWAQLRQFDRAVANFPGVVTACSVEGSTRAVTFANGNVVREVLVGIDEERRRIAYAVTGGRFSQHASSMQIVDDSGTCRLIWVSDFLPDEVEPLVRGLMEQGSEALERSFGS
jgi:hypothetical protein